jgi:predicted enzyme related to lactoylglutathione lyase
MTGRFQHFELRTTAVAVATNFYVGVFGAEFWSRGRVASVLPERALALGAKPHWVGHLGVDEPVATAARIVEQGGQQLGPARADADGSPSVIVRDPFGAMLALGPRREASPPNAVSWHVLHTTDLDPACAFYERLFGWHALAEEPVPGMRGVHQRRFAWEKGGVLVGSVTNAAASPSVHRQWLHFFEVPEIGRSVERVRREGGYALEPVTSRAGDRFAAVDDAQGAAFGLHQLAPR